MKRMGSDQYWKSQAALFARLYEKKSMSSPSGIVALFLKQRTDILSHFMPKTKNQKILDVGCGSGIHMVEYVPRCKSITGVDYSKQMLDVATVELQKTKKRNWKLVQADATRISLPSGTFDSAYAMGLLDYVEHPKKVCLEVHRLLKPNGIFVVSIPKNPSLFGFLRTPFGKRIKKTIFRLPQIDNAMTEEMLQTLFSSTGFSMQKKISLWSAMWMIKAIKK